MADSGCTDDLSFHRYLHEWVLCYNGEEECISVKFKGADINGAKGVLDIDRSWVDRDDVVIKYPGEIIEYEGRIADWTVKIIELSGTNTNSAAVVQICYSICPYPTVSTTSVSNYTPESGESVDFTGYANSGVGHEIVSKEWDFGDYTTSTEDNPSHAWTHIGTEAKDFIVTLKATNECGKTKYTTTTITVQPAAAKTGIEIQFPASMDGKDLVVYESIPTVLDLWWGGPVLVDNVLWKRGRCVWNDIDSTKVYAVQCGDPCETDILREPPAICAGTFSSLANVIIMIRNPGFDFRVYSGDHLHTLSDTTFSVLYLDSTGGDIIDEFVTGRICGLIGIDSGSECDAFWAEFYDPAFVANYMEIQATGKDLFGNDRELGLLDHIAFIASIIGSLPAFNLFPFAGITKTLGKVVPDLIAHGLTATGSKLSDIGTALKDVCKNSAQTIVDLTEAEIENLRVVLRKVYGDNGDKYVDDALAIAGDVITKQHELLVGFANGVEDLTKADVEAIIGDTPADFKALVDKLDETEDLAPVISSLTDGTDKEVLGDTFTRVGNYWDVISDAKGKTLAEGWVDSSLDVAKEALKAPDPADIIKVPADMEELAFEFRPIIEECSETVTDNIIDAVEELKNEPSGNWMKKGIQFFDRKILGLLQRVRGKPKAKVHFSDYKTRYAKWKAIFNNLEDYQKFTFYTMLAWGIYETTSWVGTYIVPKWFGFFPEQAAFRQRQHNDNMEAASWICKVANDYGQSDVLFAGMGQLKLAIGEAEEHLEDNKVEFETGGVYEGFSAAIEIARLQLAIVEEWLGVLTPTGYLECISNEAFFYVEIDGSPAAFSFANKSTLIEDVPTGDHEVRIYKTGVGECIKTVTITEGSTERFDCQMGGVEPCTPPIPKITAATSGVANKAVIFTGNSSSESKITWWDWDFGDGWGDQGQYPTHTFKTPGNYTVRLTVTDACDTVSTTHEITITPEGTCTPPTPRITATTTGITNEAITFTGAASTESSITWWKWDFGDGTSSSSQSPSHIFTAAGTYTVRLSVTDDCGITSTSHTITITTAAMNTATIYVKTPVDGSNNDTPLAWNTYPEIFITQGTSEEQAIGETAPETVIFGGFGNLPMISPTTVTIKATGYQDVSKVFNPVAGYSRSWEPLMYPIGYTEPIPAPDGCIKNVTSNSLTVSINKREYAEQYLVRCSAYFTDTNRAETRDVFTTDLITVINNVRTGDPYQVVIAMKYNGNWSNLSSVLAQCTTEGTYPISFYLPSGAYLSWQVSVSRVVQDLQTFSESLRRIQGR